MVQVDSVLTHGIQGRTWKLNHYSQRHGCWCPGHELSRCWFGFRWFGSRWDVHDFQHIMPSRHCLRRHMVEKYHCKSAPGTSKKRPPSIFQMSLVYNIFFVKILSRCTCLNSGTNIPHSFKLLPRITCKLEMVWWVQHQQKEFGIQHKIKLGPMHICIHQAHFCKCYDNRSATSFIKVWSIWIIAYKFNIMQILFLFVFLVS